MKRMLIVLLALCMALCLAACSKKEAPAAPEAASTPLPMRSATPAPTPEPTATPPVAEQQGETIQASGGAGSWSALFTEYQKRFGADIEAFNTGMDTAIQALKLMKGDLDLAFTAIFFEPDSETSVKAAFGFFGMQNVIYTEQGDTAVAQGIDPNDVPFEITLKYDGGNTAVLTYTLNSELNMELSLCVTDDYAAKLYKSYDADNPQTVCGIVKPNGDVWLGVDTKVLEGTLYQNEAAAADLAFATGLPESYTYIDGVFTKN